LHRAGSNLEDVSDAPTFRDMTAEDIAAGVTLCRQSGWNQTATDWRLLLEPPSFFRAAVVGDRVIGTAGAVVYGKSLAWVCMVLVDPADRGRGLATRLVGEVIERLPPVDTVGLDATPRGEPVYARFGFQPSARLARLEATSPASGLDAPARGRAITEGDLERVLAEDRETFGADRGNLLRNARAAAPEFAWCEADDGSVAAYGFGRRGAHAAHLGPIAALSQAAALDIVAASFARHPGERFFLDAPPRPEWHSALGHLGFREQRPFTRMYRGPSRPCPPQSYAVFGPEFG
jgi:GNAT superfamily N-acetyltransferase